MMTFKKIVFAFTVMAFMPFQSVFSEETEGAGITGPYLAAAAINVKNLEASTVFYQEVLNYTVQRSYNTENVDENVMASSSGDGSSIVLASYKNEEKLMGATRLVFYVVDAQAIVDASKKFNVDVVRAPAKIPGTEVVIGMIRDPDGNTIEIIQR